MLTLYSEHVIFPEVIDPIALLRKLTHNGREPGTMLFEIDDVEAQYPQQSIGSYQPSLAISGKDEHFTIQALTALGEEILPKIAERLPAAAQFTLSKRQITGTLLSDLQQVETMQRIQACNHSAILRAAMPNIVTDLTAYPLGLLGVFAYNFVQQRELLPMPMGELTREVDYLFYLPTRYFIVDRVRQQTYFIALHTGTAAGQQEAFADLQHMLKMNETSAVNDFIVPKVRVMQSDTSFTSYQKKFNKIKNHIVNGDAFQVVLSRLSYAEFYGDPLAVFAQLRQKNNTPFRFYMRDLKGTLLGCSPELALRVRPSDKHKSIEIHPIAGTQPRGLSDGLIDAHIDERFSVYLRMDQKELAEHAMLIDLARNDIASIAVPGTTVVQEALAIKQFSQVQHLVSKISGDLKPELDALHAYCATMNMGTLTGAPKRRAMEIINETENNPRGFYGGAVAFLTHDGNLESCIVIRALRVRAGRIYCRAGGGIVADSVLQQEWNEITHKMKSCLQALNEVSHVS